MYPFSDYFWVSIKSTDNPKAIILKTLISQQRRAQTANPDQHRLGLVVPTEKSFDGGNQFGDAKADARCAHRASHSQILSHHHRLQIMHPREHGAGDVLVTLRFQNTQHLQISWHPLDARQTGFARPDHLPE